MRHDPNLKIKIILIILISIAILALDDPAYPWDPINRNILTDINKGDTRPLKFTVKNPYTDNIVDLTGYVVKFYVKKNLTDSTYVINKTCTVSSPTTGIATVILTISDTNIAIGEYWGYLVLTDALSSVKYTMLKSKLTIIAAS